jgi:hypothetical protein
VAWGQISDNKGPRFFEESNKLPCLISTSILAGGENWNAKYFACESGWFVWVYGGLKRDRGLTSWGDPLL